MQVGSIVECISNPIRKIFDINGNHVKHIQPIVGGIYIIREIVNNETGVYLEEIINESVHFPDGWTEPGFVKTRFRELLPPETISISDLLPEKQQA